MMGAAPAISRASGSAPRGATNTSPAPNTKTSASQTAEKTATDNPVGAAGDFGRTGCGRTAFDIVPPLNG
jgi:hypothetical protein